MARDVCPGFISIGSPAAVVFRHPSLLKRPADATFTALSSAGAVSARIPIVKGAGEATRVRITAAALTHAGRVREANEDCIAVGSWHSQSEMQSPQLFEHTLEAGFVAIVADGMGGHPAGHIASEYATRRLAELLPEAETEREIAFAVRQANTTLFLEMCREPHRAAMGTAIAGLTIRDGSITVFNVGDVRAYRLDQGELVQLSTDDTMDPGWEPGSTLLPRSGMLTQCLGGMYDFNDIAPHVDRESFRPGATYLLCSDGLHEVLARDEIVPLIGPDLARSAQALFDAAMDAASTDNVSIILVRAEPA